jgi:hypothetical protein
MSSQGAISWLNAKIGQPDGPPLRVVAIQGMEPASDIDSTYAPGDGLKCHGTLVFAEGKTTGFAWRGFHSGERDQPRVATLVPALL